jgi:hypothetical protein
VNGGGSVDFEQVLKEVVWRLVSEGSISYRRIKLSFGLDDDGLEELRRELIVVKRFAADTEGEFLVLAAQGRLASPERTALSQPLPALRQAEKPPAPAADRDLPGAERPVLSSRHTCYIKREIPKLAACLTLP